MTALREALGAAFPAQWMASDTAKSIAAGMAKIERKRMADVTAAPMRELFDMLAQGEVYEIDGMSVMPMPATADEKAAWCAVGPAIRGWIDLWSRIGPDIGTSKMRYLADRLDEDKPLTPRLVEQARAEFEATIARIPELPEGAITDGILRTRIAWEVERINRRKAV